MKLKNKFLAVGSAIAMSAFATSANAAVLIQGLGTWTDGIIDTPYTTVGQSFTFSFLVNNPLDSNPTTNISNFTYALGGNPVVGFPPPYSAEFFKKKDGGGFDLNFGLFTAEITGKKLVDKDGFFKTPNKSLFDIDVYFNGIPTLKSEVGPSELDFSPSLFSGDGYLTVTSVAAVPEPSTWVMMGLGFGFVGAAMRRSRVRTTNVAFA